MAVLLLPILSAAAADPPVLHLALAGPDGVVSVLHRRGDAEEPATGPLARSRWRPFELRGAPRHDPRLAGGVVEIPGPAPRLQVRGGLQLVAFEADVDSGHASSGLAAVRGRGAVVLLRDSGGRFGLADGGAALSRGGRHLALVLEGDEVEEMALLDLASGEPALATVPLPGAVKDVEPRSLTLTADAAFLSTRSDDGSWWVHRVALDASPGGARPAAEPVAGPFARPVRSMASSEHAVAFVAGDGSDALDVFVATASGPAVNVTTDPGELVETDPASNSLAVSDDGLVVAYNREIDDTPELFVHDRRRADSGGEHVTRDGLFNPYIDQESWIFFNRAGGLVFVAGHDTETADVFRLDPAAPSALINLTRTGTGIDPPFLRKGTLIVTSLAVAPGDILVVSASGFEETGAGALAVADMQSGSLEIADSGLTEVSGFFEAGGDLVFSAVDATGARGLHLLRDRSVIEVATGLAGDPLLVTAGATRAFAGIPGAGIFDLGAGGAPKLLVAAPDVVSLAAAGDEGEALVFTVPADAGPGFDAFLLDPGTGTTVRIAGGMSSGTVLAVDGPSAEALDELFHRFARGDANDDGHVDIADAVTTLIFLFGGAGPLRCADAADADDDGAISIADAIRVLLALFRDGVTLPPPYPERGVDPTTDGLGCARG